MTPSPEARLVDGLAAGDESAFAAAYDRYGAALFRVARAVAGSHDAAEDAVQDVFVAMVRAGARLRAVRDLKAYLFASVRRAAARRRAKPGRRPVDALDAAAATEVQPPDVGLETAARLDRAVAALPRAQREVLALHLDAGLTFAECAEVLGISPNTAASRYRYALERLRTALGRCTE